MTKWQYDSISAGNGLEACLIDIEEYLDYGCGMMISQARLLLEWHFDPYHDAHASNKDKKSHKCMNKLCIRKAFYEHLLS